MDIKQTLKQKIRAAVYPSFAIATTSLAKKHRHLSGMECEELRDILRRHYFSQRLNYFAATPEQYLESSEGQEDMLDHTDRRTNFNRSHVIPWLASALPLAGCRILEIGCGTGASTVTLAEQGCDVTAVDVNQGNLRAAQERCRIYDLKAQFICCNATDVHEVFPAGTFGLIVFFATLEHLTYAERLAAMKSTWEMLEPGALWCVVDTPNRLWCFDHHTAQLPFFNWLPDDLALDYASHSDRAFMKAYEAARRDEVVKLDFARRGRGVSYHEFDLALDETASLDVVSAMDVYLRDRSLEFGAKWRMSQHGKYERMLRSLGPKIHPGFYQPNLNLIVRKH